MPGRAASGGDPTCISDIVKARAHFFCWLAMTLAIGAVAPTPAMSQSCSEAATAAEVSEHIPPGLLLAIGNVESGRTDETGVRTPWPWTVQAAGVGRFFADAADAVAAVQTLRAAGVRSIDVGCFQVNLFYHPEAFADLPSGFDPQTNALAAARFLADLRSELGDWDQAVAAYHSRVETLGGPYRDHVLAAWHGAVGGAANSGAPSPNVHFSPFARSVAFGVQVWVPGNVLLSPATQSRPATYPSLRPAAARAVRGPALIAMSGTTVTPRLPAAQLHGLPRIITPSTP
jgi:hypothetical protein